MRKTRPRTESEKKQSSAAMTKQWEDVRAMRRRLGIHVSDIVTYYVRLREAGLVEKVIAGNAAAIRDAKELMDGQMPLFEKVAREKYCHAGESVDDVVKRVAKTVVANVPGLNDMKIMLWAIEKIGSVEAAAVAFERAKKSLL